MFTEKVIYYQQLCYNHYHEKENKCKNKTQKIFNNRIEKQIFNSMIKIAECVTSSPNLTPVESLHMSNIKICY